MATTIASIGRLERHEPSGMFYNWYDPATLEKLRVWPVDGSTVQPFLSSADNAWATPGLLLGLQARPSLASVGPTGSATSMDFGSTTTRPRAPRPDPRRVLDEPPAGCSVADNYRDRGPIVYYSSATTARSTPSRGWRRTSGSRRARSWPSTTTARSVPSRRQLRLVVDGDQAGRVLAGVRRRPASRKAPYRGMKIVPAWGGACSRR